MTGLAHSHAHAHSSRSRYITICDAYSLSRLLSFLGGRFREEMAMGCERMTEYRFDHQPLKYFDLSLIGLWFSWLKA